MVGAGLDLQATCQQGKELSTTGCTLGARIATAAGIPASHQIAMLTTLIKGGWRPLSLSEKDSSKLSSIASVLCDPSLDPAVLSEFLQSIAMYKDQGDWSWAGCPGVS
jgi:hypothetical protein